MAISGFDRTVVIGIILGCVLLDIGATVFLKKRGHWPLPPENDRWNRQMLIGDAVALAAALLFMRLVRPVPHPMNYEGAMFCFFSAASIRRQNKGWRSGDRWFRAHIVMLFTVTAVLIGCFEYLYWHSL